MTLPLVSTALTKSPRAPHFLHRPSEQVGACAPLSGPWHRLADRAQRRQPRLHSSTDHQSPRWHRHGHALVCHFKHLGTCRALLLQARPRALSDQKNSPWPSRQRAGGCDPNGMRSRGSQAQASASIPKIIMAAQARRRKLAASDPWPRTTRIYPTNSTHSLFLFNPPP